MTTIKFASGEPMSARVVNVPAKTSTDTYTQAEIDAKLGNFYTKDEITIISGNMYTKSEIDAEFAKIDAIFGDIDSALASIIGVVS